MKNYMYKYMLIALAITGLMHATEPLVVWGESVLETTPPEDAAPASTVSAFAVSVANDTQENICVAFGTLTNDKKINFSYTFTVAPGYALHNAQPAQVLLVAKTEDALNTMQGQSVMKFRVNPFVQSKMIPSNCTGVLLYTVSKGALKGLRITEDKAGIIECSSSPSAAQKAWKATKAKARGAVSSVQSGWRKLRGSGASQQPVAPAAGESPVMIHRQTEPTIVEGREEY